MKSFRLRLLPFFRWAIHFHGDGERRGAAEWVAVGPEVKSGHFLN